EAQGGRSQAARKLGHERHASRLHLVLQLAGIVRRVDIECRAAIDTLAVLAGCQNGQMAVPLRRENEDDVDVVPLADRTKAVDLCRIEIASRLLSQMADLAADRPDFEA